MHDQRNLNSFPRLCVTLVEHRGIADTVFPGSEADFLLGCLFPAIFANGTCSFGNYLSPACFDSDMV